MHNLQTLIARLNQEAADLGTNLQKLSDFVMTDAFEDLPDAERYLLHDQYAQMINYAKALGARLSYYLEEEDREKHQE